MMDMLNAMSLEQLDALITTVRELTEAKKAAQRKNEIIAEMNDLFAELIEMNCCLYVNTDKDTVEIEGDVCEQGSGEIYIY